MITQGVDAVLTIVRAILSRFKEDSKVHLGLFKRFTLQELQVATDNFRETNIVDVNAFGKVYRGKLADNSLVAVKRLYEDRSHGQEEFQAVGDLINYICFHRNILRVIGFCMTSKERIFVYPFMANGNLKTCLRASKHLLNWPTRMQIALGAARGLSFLHERCDPKIIHGDLHSSNIFLDEEFEAVLGNFYLARQMGYKDDDGIIGSVRGTSGFIDPDYCLTGKLSEKCDVYGYGMTLLELITGLQSFTIVDEDVIFLKDRVEQLLKEKTLDNIVDPKLKNNYVKEEMESLIQIALLCTQGEPEHRPKMSEVVRMIQGSGPGREMGRARARLRNGSTWNFSLYF
ncbi:somatic embryogenesis receptor kinase 1-like isoform X2 [Dioscorea cayenensis subsp. rotundata]|uniref:non-specific serine/threonine protein kinase n=1 Tax=Dioscorea cayennensis subsp. rotundata TaxID=55577 RepID=A0AB40D4X0_DIOCR|nr:somatic embryogenesis receptor kinase 1-like isoform X2 [Dioscorea cayenensis subsp. rotundata]